MGRFATKKFGLIMSVVITLCLVVALCVVFLYKPADAPTLQQISNDDTVQAVDGVIDSGVRTATGSVTGGSYEYTETSPYQYTATASAGYVFAYWQDSAGVKFAGDISISTTKQGCTPVFIQESAVQKVNNQTTLQAALNNASANSNAMIVLTNDIKIDNTFVPVSSFAGVLDGAGYCIDGLAVTGDNNIGGICGTLTGVIKNLEIRGSVIGTGTVGAFAGVLQGGLVSRCSNFAVVNAGSTGTAGGIVAAASGAERSCSIYYCANYGSITGNNVGAVIFTNGTSTSPICNLIQNVNGGALQTVNIS